MRDTAASNDTCHDRDTGVTVAESQRRMRGVSDSLIRLLESCTDLERQCRQCSGRVDGHQSALLCRGVQVVRAELATFANVVGEQLVFNGLSLERAIGVVVSRHRNPPRDPLSFSSEDRLEALLDRVEIFIGELRLGARSSRDLGDAATSDLLARVGLALEGALAGLRSVHNASRSGLCSARRIVHGPEQQGTPQERRDAIHA